MRKIITLIVILTSSFLYTLESYMDTMFYKEEDSISYEITARQFLSNWEEEDGNDYFYEDVYYYAETTRNPIRALLVSLLISIIPLLRIIFPRISKRIYPLKLKP